MKKLLIFTFTILMFFLFSCDDNNKNQESTNSDQDQMSELTDEDEITVADSDDVSTDEALADNDEQSEPDVDENFIDAGLDESFMEPSKGFSFKIVAPLLSQVPSSYNLEPEEKPIVLKGSMTDRNGNNIVFSNKDNAFAATYEDYLYATSRSESPDSTYYSATILPSFSTLDWMAENSTDTINATFFYLYIYKNEVVGSNLFRICPYAIPDDKGESFLKLYIDGNQWKFDNYFGLMINSYLTFDKKAIATFFGNELYNLCHCYDIGENQSMTERNCTAEDMDTDPMAAYDPSPADGEENQPLDIELSWKAGSDPDGGEVQYSLAFGTVNPPEIVVKNMASTSWKPEETLTKNTRYFWQVNTTDDEGNTIKGKIWTFDTNETAIEIPKHDFLILVNGELEGKLDDALQVYSEDVENDGYQPAIRYWTPGGAQVLKKILKNSYDLYSLKGAVLIGDMPSAEYEQTADYGDSTGTVYEEFPSEYFFMDMDGTWEDTDNNGLFDSYSEPLTLEIFTSRIIGTAEEISEYLNRVHTYKKNGSFFSTRNFFSFIDDDWNSYEDENGSIHDLDYMKNLDWNLGSIYGENYERREDPDNTTKTTYLDFMTTEGAEFVYQWIHSDPQRIYFDDNFSPNPSNILSIDEIINDKVKGSFYNLFDCSISRYTEKDGNIASEYIKGEYGLATIGSTKTGGIYNPEVMHSALAAGENWGTAYQLWVNDIWENYKNYGFDKPYIDSWWLGMMIQGDPTLKLTEKKSFFTKRNIVTKKYSRKFLDWMNSTLVH